MPGPYIHISTMRHVAALLAEKQYHPLESKLINPQTGGADTKELGKIMQQHPNFASLGAIGPDLFFFLPDFRDITIAGKRLSTSSILTHILDFLEGLYDTLDPYISKWEHYIGPISEDTGEEMSRLTGGLSETVGDITGELGAIITTALEDFLVQQNDWLSFFSLGLNKGFDEQAYFWSDMLHYRETNTFAQTLLKNANASEKDEAVAYALGYMTHMGTDTIDHSFVNAISGGPFRLHWQRHHLVENHMDSFWYLQDGLSPKNGNQYPQLTESALYYDIAFTKTGGTVNRPTYPRGETLRENWERKRKLDIDSDLADPIADVLLQTMKDVYYKVGEKHPEILQGTDGQPTTDQIDEAYRLLFRFLKVTTVDGFAHEPPPPPDVFPNLDFPTPTDANDDPPGDVDGGSFWDDLLDFFLAIIAAIAYIVEVAVYLATLPWAVLADVVTYPLRLGLYYALELPLFHLLKMLRSVLVMTGYIHPMEDEIAPTLIEIGNTGKSNVTLLFGFIGDIFGGLPQPVEPKPDETFRDVRYPYSHPSDEFSHPWDYPSPDVPSELPLTTVGPFAIGANPSILFSDMNPDPALRDAFETADSPAVANRIGQQVTPTRHLGDGVNFCKYLIWRETRTDKERQPLVEWNLDSDRGYGYHCWEWNRDTHGTPQPDPEGNFFQPPCTWPSQSDHDLDPGAPMQWNPAIPLKIHWVGKGLTDPGCTWSPVDYLSGDMTKKDKTDLQLLNTVVERKK
jgi:hypothetical protein